MIPTQLHRITDSLISRATSESLGRLLRRDREKQAIKIGEIFLSQSLPVPSQLRRIHSVVDLVSLGTQQSRGASHIRLNCGAIIERAECAPFSIDQTQLSSIGR